MKARTARTRLIADAIDLQHLGRAYGVDPALIRAVLRDGGELPEALARDIAEAADQPFEELFVEFPAQSATGAGRMAMMMDRSVDNSTYRRRPRRPR